MPNNLYYGHGSSDERSEIFAKYIIETGATVRETAKNFGLSKSTVHKDVTEKLSYVNPALFSAVREILDKNKSERHIRGGEATKIRYNFLKKQKEGLSGSNSQDIYK